MSLCSLAARWRFICRRAATASIDSIASSRLTIDARRDLLLRFYRASYHQPAYL